MKTTIGAIALCLLASGCATDRQVARSLSELEMRRIAVETGLAERVTKVEATASTALATSRSALKLAEGKFSYEQAGPEQVVHFDKASAQLSLDARARLTALAANLKSSNRNVFIEIQGHTDDAGGPELNLRVGQARAESVRTFLYQQGVALNRMSVVSFGETAPANSSQTAAGRQANRRVVLLFKM